MHDLNEDVMRMKFEKINVTVKDSFEGQQLVIVVDDGLAKAITVKEY